MKFGGFSGLAKALPNPQFMHLWAGAATGQNPMGVDWIALVSGLGFVLSFGYWCTDSLLCKEPLAAEDLNAAQRTPLIAAFPQDSISCADCTSWFVRNIDDQRHRLKP